MYILVVSYGFPTDKYPNNGIFQFDQSKALKKAGNKVIFVAIDLRSIRRRRKWGIENFIEDGIEVFNFNFPIGPISSNLLRLVGRYCFELLYNKILKKHGKPDIVHAHFGDTAEYAARLCKKEKLPFVITEHSSGLNKPKLSLNIVEHMKQVYEVADKVIVVSRELGKNLCKTMEMKTKCIHNMVDTSIFSYVPHVRTDKFQFVSVGLLDYRKGYDLLLYAFSDVLKTYPPCCLTIYGDGPEKKTLEKQSRELGISHAVNFMGQVSRNDISKGFGSSDAFVLASRRETFGVVYIEAMASGLPVIATKCGGPEDFVTPETGLLIPSDDIGALQEAMLYIINKYEKYDSRKISEYAKSKFSPERIANELIECFNEVIETHKDYDINKTNAKEVN